MEIIFCESGYPEQVNVRVDAETGEMLRALRERKVKIGPIIRPAICERIREAYKKVIEGLEEEAS